MFSVCVVPSLAHFNSLVSLWTIKLRTGSCLSEANTTHQKRFYYPTVFSLKYYCFFSTELGKPHHHFIFTADVEKQSYNTAEAIEEIQCTGSCGSEV